MKNLFKNAIDSIQLGVEDYQRNDPKRALSAVRNFYSGTLILAKTALLSAAPNATLEEILGEGYKPVPNGSGGVDYVAKNKKTVDFNDIAARFKDFGLKIDHAALMDLNRIRADIEHKYSDASHDAVREAIAKAFPVVYSLFGILEEEPRDHLGDAWSVMLEVREFYEAELAASKKTFEAVDWKFNCMAEASISCPTCGSHLLAQDDPTNTSHERTDATCKQCNARIEAQQLIEHALENHFEVEGYLAIKDGADSPLDMCPECAANAYVTYDEEVGCVWCGTELGDCPVCHTGLNPQNVSADNTGLCSYCDNLMSKND